MSKKRKQVLNVIFIFGCLLVSGFIIYSFIYLMAGLQTTPISCKSEDSHIPVINTYSAFSLKGVLDTGVLVADDFGQGYICKEGCNPIVNVGTGLLRGNGVFYGYSGDLATSSPSGMYSYFKGITIQATSGELISDTSLEYSDFSIWEGKLYAIKYVEISDPLANISQIDVYNITESGLGWESHTELELEVVGDPVRPGVFYSVFPREPQTYVLSEFGSGQMTENFFCYENYCARYSESGLIVISNLPELPK